MIHSSPALNSEYGSPSIRGSHRIQRRDAWGLKADPDAEILANDLASSRHVKDACLLLLAILSFTGQYAIHA